MLSQRGRCSKCRPSQRDAALDRRSFCSGPYTSFWHRLSVKQPFEMSFASDGSLGARFNVRILIYIYAGFFFVFLAWSCYTDLKDREPWWETVTDAILLSLGGIGMISTRAAECV